MSAVSKKLMPASTARRMNGRLASSASTHGRQTVEPKVIVPRQRREIRRPVRPRLTYCIRGAGAIREPGYGTVW